MGTILMMTGRKGMMRLRRGKHKMARSKINKIKINALTKLNALSLGLSSSQFFNTRNLLVFPLGGTFDGVGSAMVRLSGCCLRQRTRVHLCLYEYDFSNLHVLTLVAEHS